MFAKKSGATRSSPAEERRAQEQVTSDNRQPEDEHLLSSSGRGSSLAGSLSAPRSGSRDGSSSNSPPEKQRFLLAENTLKPNTLTRKAKLAKQESIDEKPPRSTCGRMRMLILLLTISCIVAAIYCIPYIQIEPRIPKLLPHIPFNFREAPLRQSSASQFKLEHLFYQQFYGAESVAVDSQGNMYLAVEGGFVLYAHLNQSSPVKRQYVDSSGSNPPSLAASPTGGYPTSPYLAADDKLVKIAELNAIKQLPYETQRRRAREGAADGSSWRRECQLDEKLYGPNLYSGGGPPTSSAAAPNEIELDDDDRRKKFVSNVAVSRCSKPLGVRLSADESYLYVVDTLSGLYRVSLRVSDRPHSSQRLVTKLIDFRANKSGQLLPVHSDQQAATSQQQLQSAAVNPQADNGLAGARAKTAPIYLNVSLLAVDDLVIDPGAGTRGSDIIYLSVGSQSWPAVGFIYDMLEGRPTGVVLRYDTGANQLSVLDPNRLSHVRTSMIDLTSANSTSRYYTNSPQSNGTREELYLGIGAPRLDENDVFDDRPLHFPNGVELTDDREAILIADTVNKRILKHYVRGHRKGTTDLWAWTPNYPDNIRRGYDRRQETYWVVGCGHDNTDKVDLHSWLSTWPRLRKYILKNIYLFGWFVETIGEFILRSTSVRDFGYSFKIGHSLCENMCSGMMILQYNKYGDIVRSIYSNEFPNDVVYYSQVNEVIDAHSQEHILYLSSPAYRYVTKLTLPTDSFDLPPPKLMNEIR